MKDKITIKTNILIALIYFLGAIGIIPGLLMAGYALIVQKEEECKKPAYIAIGASLFTTFISRFIFAPVMKYTNSSRVYSNIESLSYWLNIIVALLLVILGILALCGVKINLLETKTQEDKKPQGPVKADPVPVEKKNMENMGTAEREFQEVEKINGETDQE